MITPKILKIAVAVFALSAAFTVEVHAAAVSPDGSTLTVAQSQAGGTLVTTAGTWNFGAASNAYGNIVQLNGVGNGYATLLEVANGGQMFAQASDHSWWKWNNPGWTSSTAPTGQVSPDGSTLTVTQSQAGGTLVTTAGTWNFGAASNAYGNIVQLNGVVGNGYATLLEVANGGQMFAQASDHSWWKWNNPGWTSSTAPTGQVSPDGSTLTVTQSQAGGTLVTTAGTWNFGAASNAYGNAILLNGGSVGGWATLLEVANGGQMYAQASDDSWWRWNNGWSSSTAPTGQVSPDGSTLTFTQSQAGGTLVTTAGTWNFGAASNAYGNAILLNGGSVGGWATLLEVANGGQLYAQASDDSWWRWNNGWSSSAAPNIAGAVSVILAPYGNVYALVNEDGSQVQNGGIDGHGNAYSETLTGSSVTWAGVTFTLGASGTANGVRGATVRLLPAGNYSSVRLLATAVNGNQTLQRFVVSYTSGPPTTTTITQSLTDWQKPLSDHGNYQGESTALAMSHWVTQSGTTQSGSVNLYGYELAIDGARTVNNIQLPANVVVVAMALIAVGPTTYSSACNPHTAIGDGTTDNTTMIQNAIDACFAQGGGVVELSAQDGTSYLTRPITLKSNVQLQIDSGVMLKAKWSVGDGTYTPAYINWVYQAKEALISANGADHIGIIGNGIIDGSGNAAWWALHDSEEDYLPQQPPTHDPPYFFSKRPWLLEFYKCDTVTVSGVKLQNPPYWTQALRFSNNITEYGVVIDAPGGSTNTDGVDVVGSTNVTLSDLNIGVGDDNIAIKSGLPIFERDPRQAGPPRLPQMATAHVRVSNIFAGNNNAGITVGDGSGIVIGSEASNGVNDVTIQHVFLNGTSYGFRIKSQRDRGAAIHDISVEDMGMAFVPYPLVLETYYKTNTVYGLDNDPAQAVTATTPDIHDITLQHVTATNSGHASAIGGLPEKCIRNVALSHVFIDSGDYGILLRHMTGTFTDVTSTPPFVVRENVTVKNSGGTLLYQSDPKSGQVACSAQ